ncbi:MAG: hypothetical protein Q9221_002141 [Calogaya cf. arnoldii]
MKFPTALVAAFAALVAAAPKANNDTPDPSDSIIRVNVVSLKNETKKIDRAIELVIDYNQVVRDTEPDTLEHDIIFDKEEAKFIVYSVYKDEKALDYHLESHYLAELLATVEREDLERQAVEEHFLEPIAGFERAGSCD